MSSRNPQTPWMEAGGLVVLLFLCQAAGGSEELVIHEWGTFTCLQDENGKAVGGINTDDEPVPKFVHNLSEWLLLRPTEVPPIFFQGAPSCHPDVTMRLETPVVYFHPQKQTDLSNLDVRVEFRGGWLTQFYPDAEAIAPGIPTPHQGSRFGPLLSSTISKLSWKIRKVGINETGPETKEHVWLSPRAVDAASIQTDKEEVEKFLFYRGVGHIDAPLRLARSKDGASFDIRSESLPWTKSTDVLKIERLWLVDIRRDGTVAFRPLPSVSVTSDVPKIAATTASTFETREYASGNLKRLRDSLRGELINEGLFADEADALLNTWNLSYFKSPGLRLFFIVPRAWTDHYLPLEVSVPASVKRAMVGRIELVSPEHRVLLHTIASKSVSDIQADQKRLYDICYAGALTGKNREQSGRVWSGEAPISSLGMNVPESYQAYVNLGRFRNALILNEQQLRPTEGLTQFIQTYNLEGYPPALLSAAEEGDLPLVQTLLASGGAVSLKDASLTTALMAGARRPEVVNLLLGAGADVNARNTDGETALMRAASGGSIASVRRLIEAGAEVNVSDRSGETILLRTLCAGSSAHFAIADLLKKAGAKEDDQTAFIEATVRADIPSMQTLIAKGVGVNMTIPRGTTPLLLATAKGNAAVVEALIANGANVKYQDKYGRTCLMEAIRQGKEYAEMVKLLIAKGADVNAKAEDGHTALIRAASKGCIEIARSLIEAGAHVDDAGTYSGGTPLECAVAFGQGEMIKLLCTKGISRNSLDTVLAFSIRNGQTAGVRSILSLGVDPNKTGSSSGCGTQPLVTIAAESGHTDVVRLLLEKGAHVNARTNSGSITALMASSLNGHSDTVVALLENGADLTATADGNTAMMYAAWGGHTDTLKLLIERGGNLQERTKDGRNLLMGAAQFLHGDAVKFLIERGLDVNLKDKKGSTALMTASSSIGDGSVVKVLIESGADVNAKDKKGRTALGIALHDKDARPEQKAETVKLLRKYGAKE